VDTPSTVSVIIGAVSVAVAVIAMWQASSAAKESRVNFERTRDLLAEIDKRAAITEQVVAENQRELLDTVKKLAIPEKPDVSDEMGKMFMAKMLESPDGLGDFLGQIALIAEFQNQGIDPQVRQKS